jgi:putative tryptophan/tyrosine transport system substrate-binding protein
MTPFALGCAVWLLILVVVAPFPAAGQARMPRVGILGTTTMDPRLRDAFAQALGSAGYSEGQGVLIDARDAAGRPARLGELAGDLVKDTVDVIVARGPGALEAAQRATTRIPIVAVDLESDPVQKGFVRNLAQPGGNITGVFLDLPELSGKQLQLLKEAIPQASRVAIIGDLALNAPQFVAAELAAQKLGLQSQRIDVRTPEDFDSALETASRGRASAVLLLSSPLVFTGRDTISSLALKRRLPAISMFVEFADAGGLMTYGPSVREAFHRAGGYVGRILKGAKPRDLPVERPTKFDLVINLKTANAVGVAIPPSLLPRADRMIR